MNPIDTCLQIFGAVTMVIALLHFLNMQFIFKTFVIKGLLHATNSDQFHSVLFLFLCFFSTLQPLCVIICQQCLFADATYVFFCSCICIWLREVSWNSAENPWPSQALIGQWKESLWIGQDIRNSFLIITVHVEVLHTRKQTHVIHATTFPQSLPSAMNVCACACVCLCDSILEYVICCRCRFRRTFTLSFNEED